VESDCRRFEENALRIRAMVVIASIALHTACVHWPWADR